MHHKLSHHVLCLLIPALVIGAFVFARPSAIPSTSSSNTVAEETAVKAIVYRSPSCGCCGQYVSYLKKNGFDVETQYINSAEERDTQNGVPGELASCHTTVIGDYAIEGHVPMEAIEKLLSEKPALRGIALPAMPNGSPGMPGAKVEPFDIKGFSVDGTVSDFMTL